jgi:hypothetical protein
MRPYLLPLPDIEATAGGDPSAAERADRKKSG